MSKDNANYSNTLNLPNTSFGMKANLTQREPQQRKAWASQNIYRKIQDTRKDAPLYTLHDGPPYANGDIHMGHVINKVLKDFVIKYKTMTGFRAPYIPGWDCHGLPIEAKVVTELGEKAKTMSKPEIRKLCMKYASKYVKLQSKQFQDLSVFGDFENPYLTFKPQYEAGILEVFAEMVGNGLVYKQLKPIHWSVGCETALAEAELEYKDIASPSIFVNFPVAEESLTKLIDLGLITQPSGDTKVCFMIWTTTPWTLAANLAVAVNPNLEYRAITYKCNDTMVVSIICTERIQAVITAAKLDEGQYQLSEKSVKGSDLEALRYEHPFVKHSPNDKNIHTVICADYVTTEDGTGLVHIAPGHGLEDYISGQKYGLPVYSPVKNDGCYDDTVPQWLRGKNVLKVDGEVIEHLSKNNYLVAEQKITHSYPHCWRSKMPVIFRATEQWFISVDKVISAFGKSLRDLSLESVRRVKWIPAWGQKRIEGMLESRPDWCISRQRSWGLPIPVFVNSQNKALLTKESVLAVSRHIAKKGSDSWFTDSPREILGEDFKLPEGFSWDDLQKEENIFDVWFESGCSWYSVAKNAGWPVPVDLYLEGSDQHRGWFQLSLLPALGSFGKEPFKAVLTHGFTVDEKGMKQSKSLGNYVSAQEEVTKYGADILRLWVSSVNYQEDIRCNDELIGRTQDAYRKIRNTIKYLLGNLYDFEPQKNSVAYNDMSQIDKWAMQQLQILITEVRENYESFIFHRVFALLYNFCTVQMSSIYMDVLKDRLYCDAADSRARRSSQTAMYHILDSLIRMLAPILAFTAEEAWAAMQHKSQNIDTVHLAAMPQVDKSIDTSAEESKWTKIMTLRDDVLVVLEGLRKDKTIASNQQASVTIAASDNELIQLLEQFGIEQFASLCIVSEIKIERTQDNTKITAGKSSHQKCQRCWNFWPTVGKNPEHPDLCERCIKVVIG
ncbi:MAG: isoleucine--tRNA ligase [Phycisphaerae bacterium]